MNNKIKRLGIMLVISSPSGAGKTTLARKLLEQDKEIKLSISVTTRKPRKVEKNNEDYIFITEDKFKKMVDESQDIYEKMLEKTTQSLEEIIKNTESSSKVQ